MKKIYLLVFVLNFYLFGSSCAQQPDWQWGRAAGGAGNDLGNAISTDINGNSYVTGRFNATDTFGLFTVTSYGGPDIFLAKYNTSGSCLWVKHGGSYDVNDIYGDEGDGVDIDGNGNEYITGNFYTQATFGALTLTCPTAHRQIFVVKYDSSGNEIWAQQPTGGISNNYSRAIAVDAAGNSYITGYLGGGTNTFGAFTISHPGAFVVKYDPSGNVVYATSLATNGAVDAYGINADQWGNVYVTGYLQGTDVINGQTFTSTGDRDAFLVKVDAAGNFEWLVHTQSIAGTYTYGRGVSVDMQGNPIITGDFDDYIIVGPFTLSGTGFGTESFAIKYDSAGNPLWAKQSLAANGFGSGTQGFAITSDLNSNAVITGVYRDAENFGTHALGSFGTQTFVALYDSSGNCQWAVGSTGQNPGAFGYGISTDNNGSYFIAGFDKYGPVFGNYILNAFGGEDIFVAKLGVSVAQANYTTGDSTICPGSCISFANFSLNATSYQWYFPGAIPGSSTDANPVNICYNTPGNYDVQLIAANANGSDTLLISNYITVYPLPAQQAISQSGDTLFAYVGAVSYQWFYNSNLIPGGTNYFYLATASGDYSVVATDKNGCEVEAAVFNVVASVQFETSGLGFDIYPNPVVDKCSIQISKLQIGTPVEISIYNMLGVLVAQPQIIKMKPDIIVDISVLSKGMYWLELNTSGKMMRSQFVKQ